MRINRFVGWAEVPEETQPKKVIAEWDKMQVL